VPTSSGEEFRENLRRQHGVRLVQGDEDGAGVARLPEGVYGFTYSPGTREMPLFSKPGQYAFEVLKIKGGGVLLTGFVSSGLAASIRGGRPCEVELYPSPREGHAEFVAVPLSAVAHVKEHSTRSKGAVEFTFDPR
jgi:hypothetical protein